MQVQMMQMDTRIARIHYRDYLKKVREHREERLKLAEEKIKEGGKTFRAGRHERSLLEEEDEELMRSFRAMARGERIINLHRTLREGGLNKERLPNLAIASVEWGTCYLHVDGRNTMFSKDKYTWSRTSKASRISTPADTFGPELWNARWREQNNLPSASASALVPAIPAHLRPAGSLHDYFILWEAVWKAEAPVDPILLRQVTNSIYTVVAQWDLTPIEQCVLEGRLRS